MSWCKLGIWLLSLNQNTFCENSEHIFIHHGACIGSAAHQCCEQLLIIIIASWEITQIYIATMSVHGGIRTAALGRGVCATHVSWATTAPPPIASIANRGDWSMGKVLNIYWQFADVGDAYLGRCLCGGLDPNLSSFLCYPLTGQWITLTYMMHYTLDVWCHNWQVPNQ